MYEYPSFSVGIKMNSQRQFLMGFPLKTFVKSEPTKDDDKGASNRSKSEVSNANGPDVKKFYETVVSEKDHGESDPLPPKSSLKHIDTVPGTSTTSIRISREPRVDYTKEQLFKAVSVSDVETIEKAVKNSAKSREILTRQTDRFGWSALMIACATGCESMVRTLLKAGADADVRDKAGNSCLTLASKKGHSAVVDLVKSAGNPVVKAGGKKGRQQIDNSLEMPWTCDLCGETCKTKTSLSKHLASLPHRLKVEEQELKERGGRVRAHYAIPRSNAGFQMMLKDGWDAGGGLGKDGEGKLYPVKTVLKRDRTGLGGSGDDQDAEGAAVRSKAKVTHFGPSDPTSVEAAAGTSGVNARQIRLGTHDKRKQASKKRKDTRKEIDFRRQFL